VCVYKHLYHCIYTYLCIHTCVYKYMYTRTFTVACHFAPSHTYTQTLTLTCTHTNTRKHSHAHTHTHTHTQGRNLSLFHIHKHTHTHLHTHPHTHPHTYICIRSPFCHWCVAAPAAKYAFTDTYITQLEYINIYTYIYTVTCHSITGVLLQQLRSTHSLICAQPN